MSPVSILNVVVFPAPFTPTRPKHWIWNKQKAKQILKKTTQNYQTSRLCRSVFKVCKAKLHQLLQVTLQHRCGPLQEWLFLCTSGKIRINKCKQTCFLKKSYYSFNSQNSLLWRKVSPWTGLLCVKCHLCFRSAGSAFSPQQHPRLPPKCGALGHLESCQWGCGRGGVGMAI